jgi:hypothetical protein
VTAAACGTAQQHLLQQQIPLRQEPRPPIPAAGGRPNPYGFDRAGAARDFFIGAATSTPLLRTPFS